MPSSPSGRSGRVWRWVALGAQLITIPAFYVELVNRDPPPWAGAVYALAALLLAVAGLATAAFLPPSSVSQAALAWRLGAAFLTLLAMARQLQRWVTRGGAAYLMLAAFGVLLLCGAGYWWLEPNTPTLADGLWLAFTTAATVGYGDVVPSTPASRIFSVFVVLLGFGVLTLATAAIATTWIETEERRIEREILRDLHHRLGALHEEIATLRAELRQGQRPPSG